MTDAILPVLDDRLSGLESIRHGFFTRKGGLSNGVYAGLNVGLASGDEIETVNANRALVADWFEVPPDHLLSVYQIHSADVITVNAPFGGQRPKADGIVTAQPGLAIGATTADCGPVLFADPAAGIIGACHAGWKGALYGVLENTIETMERLGANRQNIHAVLGPTISQQNYEVGPDLIGKLLKLDAYNDRYLERSENSDHAMFDLPGYIIGRLNHAGVVANWVGLCTYGEPENYYSYRRKTHLGEAGNGIQMSAIMLG